MMSDCPYRIATETHMHALRQGQVTFIRQRCVDQFSGIALILVGVIELGIDHANDRFVILQVESQLLLPQPIVGIANTRLFQLFDYVHIVDSVHN